MGNNACMNDEFTNRFFCWYLSDEVNKSKVAKELKNSETTIGKWRSRGVPTGKILACQSLMDKSHQKQMEELRNNLILRPTYDQFKRWNKKALDEGKIIEDWALEGLEKMADDYFESLPLVAEEDETGEYNKQPVNPAIENQNSGGDHSTDSKAS